MARVDQKDGRVLERQAPENGEAKQDVLVEPCEVVDSGQHGLPTRESQGRTSERCLEGGLGRDVCVSVVYIS